MDPDLQTKAPERMLRGLALFFLLIVLSPPRLLPAG